MSRLSRPQLALAVLGLAVVLGGGLGFLTSIRANGDAGTAARPGTAEFHGQGKWSAGERPAPGFALRDHTGARVSLAAQRGRPLLLTFLDSHCVDQCPVEARQLGIVLRQMPAALRPTVVIVSVNPKGDTPASILHAMSTWGFAGPWRWHWLRGTNSELAPVWRSYGIFVQLQGGDSVTHGTTVNLIDRQGFLRTAYLYPFLPTAVGRDLRTLAADRS